MQNDYDNVKTGMYFVTMMVVQANKKKGKNVKTSNYMPISAFESTYHEMYKNDNRPITHILAQFLSCSPWY